MRLDHVQKYKLSPIITKITNKIKYYGKFRVTFLPFLKWLSHNYHIDGI